jgi:hypothetical protein
MKLYEGIGIANQCSDAADPCLMSNGEILGFTGDTAKTTWLCTSCAALDTKKVMINHTWMPYCRNYDVCRAIRNPDTGDNMCKEWACDMCRQKLGLPLGSVDYGITSAFYGQENLACKNKEAPHLRCPVTLKDDSQLAYMRLLPLKNTPRKPEWRCDWQCSYGLIRSHDEIVCACAKGVEHAVQFYFPWGPRE